MNESACARLCMEIMSIRATHVREFPPSLAPSPSPPSHRPQRINLLPEVIIDSVHLSGPIDTDNGDAILHFHGRKVLSTRREEGAAQPERGCAERA